MPSTMHQKLTKFHQILYHNRSIPSRNFRTTLRGILQAILCFPAPNLAISIAKLQHPLIFQHTLPNSLSRRFHDHPEIPTHFLNLCWKLQHKTYFSDALFQHAILQTKKRRFRTPSVCLIFYLLIPATFCCTHSPMLIRKCSSIFIPLQKTLYIPSQNINIQRIP